MTCMSGLLVYDPQSLNKRQGSCWVTWVGGLQVHLPTFQAWESAEPGREEFGVGGLGEMLQAWVKARLGLARAGWLSWN